MHVSWTRYFLVKSTVLLTTPLYMHCTCSNNLNILIVQMTSEFKYAISFKYPEFQISSPACSNQPNSHGVHYQPWLAGA